MSGEHLSEEQYQSQVKAVWRATLYLAIITVVEVVIALTLGGVLPKFVLNSLFVIMSVWKAYFIIGEFMHVKYEKRAFALSLGLPLSFLIWGIIAFMWDGSEWLKAIVEMSK
ncbi:MAG: cytochrome C oxidase subunit IV family protein [Sphingobacteriales bacterium]|jgi:cytochrome c oxidase subunit IV|nr:MAG: cytochrome C oxidase subunit IV family protein [Sphingobacteriales bacterium]